MLLFQCRRRSAAGQLFASSELHPQNQRLRQDSGGEKNNKYILKKSASKRCIETSIKQTEHSAQQGWRGCRQRGQGSMGQGCGRADGQTDRWTDRAGSVGVRGVGFGVCRDAGGAEFGMGGGAEHGPPNLSSPLLPRSPPAAQGCGRTAFPQCWGWEALSMFLWQHFFRPPFFPSVRNINKYAVINFTLCWNGREGRRRGRGLFGSGLIIPKRNGLRTA